MEDVKIERGGGGEHLRREERVDTDGEELGSVKSIRRVEVKDSRGETYS